MEHVIQSNLSKTFWSEETRTWGYLHAATFYESRDAGWEALAELIEDERTTLEHATVISKEQAEHEAA